MILSPEPYQIQIPVRVTDCKIDFLLLWNNVSSRQQLAANWVAVSAAPAGECAGGVLWVCWVRCECEMCAALTRLGALGLVVRLGAGVALLHLQQQAARERACGVRGQARGPARGPASEGPGRAPPLFCGGHFLVSEWPSQRSLAPTPTFSETLSSFNECVRSLCVRNLSIIERHSLAASCHVRAHCALSPSSHARSYSPRAAGKRSKNILNLNNISAYRSHATAADRLPRAPDYY